MLNNLPFDLQELIGIKLHKLYMKELTEELYEECLEYEWRKENNLGDDSEWDTSNTSDTSDTDSEYSFTESDN
ncbi:MAG: hypothetical protein O3A45_02415 [Proteobacteria bacterium]|nr:hypothetical protein [Pseudomonadota bacterium]